MVCSSNLKDGRRRQSLNLGKQQTVCVLGVLLRQKYPGRLCKSRAARPCCPHPFRFGPLFGARVPPASPASGGSKPSPPVGAMLGGAELRCDPRTLGGFCAHSPSGSTQSTAAPQELQAAVRGAERSKTCTTPDPSLRPVLTAAASHIPSQSLSPPAERRDGNQPHRGAEGQQRELSPAYGTHSCTSCSPKAAPSDAATRSPACTPPAAPPAPSCLLSGSESPVRGDILRSLPFHAVCFNTHLKHSFHTSSTE